MACGKKHTVVLTSDGSIYSWGSNEFGQLGRSAQVTTLKLNVKRHLLNTPGNTSVNNFHIVGSAHTSPQMPNLIQQNSQFIAHHKIPLSTDNQALAQHKFEFPLSKGNSGDSEVDIDNFHVSQPEANNYRTLTGSFSRTLAIFQEVLVLIKILPQLTNYQISTKSSNSTPTPTNQTNNIFTWHEPPQLAVRFRGNTRQQVQQTATELVKWMKRQSISKIFAGN